MTVGVTTIWCWYSVLGSIIRVMVVPLRPLSLLFYRKSDIIGKTTRRISYVANDVQCWGKRRTDEIRRSGKKLRTQPATTGRCCPVLFAYIDYSCALRTYNVCREGSLVLYVPYIPRCTKVLRYALSRWYNNGTYTYTSKREENLEN